MKKARKSTPDQLLKELKERNAAAVTTVKMPCGQTWEDAIGWLSRLHGGVVAEHPRKVERISIEWAPAANGYAVAWNFEDPSDNKSGLKNPTSLLVGMFLHTLKEGKISFQGHVIKADKETAMVQLFSWMSGDPTNVVPMRVADLHDPDQCKLYATKEAWLAAAENAR
jgi:hypothetical protein